MVSAGIEPVLVAVGISALLLIKHIVCFKHPVFETCGVWPLQALGCMGHCISMAGQYQRSGRGLTLLWGEADQ